MDKRMQIRRDDRCAVCGTELVAGTTAYWIGTERVVRCMPCHTVVVDGFADADASGPCDETTNAHALPDEPNSPPANVSLRHTAGRSALGEYEKRSARELATKERRVAEDAKWREGIKEQRPVLGRLASVLTPKPQITPESQSTKAWKIGAEGERRVAEVLEGAAGIDVLHDRLVPGGRANIDHIVIGPSGVFVIDAKKYTGQVEARDVGGLFRTDERLYVNNRDRTKLVEGVLWQIDVVRAALGEDFADVEVRGVLCFVGCEWGWIMRTKRVRSVTALWPTALPDHVSIAGPLSDRVTEIADHLRSKLRPAT
jgi:nuclease-like protein